MAKLKERVNRLGVANDYFQTAKTFRDELSAYEWPNATGFPYYRSIGGSGSITGLLAVG